MKSEISPVKVFVSSPVNLILPVDKSIFFTSVRVFVDSYILCQATCLFEITKADS